MLLDELQPLLQLVVGHLVVHGQVSDGCAVIDLQ
jgi:hypothetical protein